MRIKVRDYGKVHGVPGWHGDGDIRFDIRMDYVWVSVQDVTVNNIQYNIDHSTHLKVNK